MATIQELDRRAVEVSRSLVGTITADRLALPTPCGAWNLGTLLAHITIQHHGFARAVAGETTQLADWQPVSVDDDPAGRYDAAVDHVLTSFAAAGTPEAMAYLPEIRGGVTVPSAVAMSFHFIDYVVHSWDVAVSLGWPVEFDDEVLAMALTVARRVPDDPASRGPDVAFMPSLAPAPGGDPLDRVLMMLGRSPNWPASPA